MFEIVRFHEDELQGTRDDRGVWVVVKRVCQALGIDESAQRRRLLRTSWAGTAVMTAPSPGGVQEMFCIELKSLPMWLATIEPSRVSSGVRPKLEVYQKEAHDVLAAHFFGSESAVAAVVSVSSDPIVAVADSLRQVAVSLEKINGRVGTVETGMSGTRLEVAECKIQIGSLTAAVQEHTDTLARMVPHRDFASHVKSELIRSAHEMGGRCPACGREQVTENGHRKAPAEFDHFYARNRNAISEGWLICRDCHRKKTAGDEDFTDQFRSFHQRRKNLPGAQIGLFDVMNPPKKRRR